MIQVYFMPGMAANPSIFKDIKLPEAKFESHYLEWFVPKKGMSISEYAKEMCEKIIHNNVVLVGVSFGGIMAQEMSKFLDAKKIIIISSVKTSKEMPKRFKMAKFTKAYKFFPTKVVSNFEDYAKYFLGKSLKKRANIFYKY